MLYMCSKCLVQLVQGLLPLLKSKSRSDSNGGNDTKDLKIIACTDVIHVTHATYIG